MDFDKAFEIVVGLEGGYVNDPHDPGGETKFGVSKRAYPMLDIAALELADAKELYLNDYWRRCQCQAMPWPIALMLFDSAINQGPRSAISLLQKGMGVVADGVLGPITLDALLTGDGPSTLVNTAAERLLRYAGHAEFARYGRGWTRRVFHIYTEGLKGF
jgi:lysozyme family protein